MEIIAKCDRYILTVCERNAVNMTDNKQDVFVKQWCPHQQQSTHKEKISMSYILTPPHPQAQVTLVKRG